MPKTENKPSAPRTYLQRLQFDPKLLGGPIAAYISNIRIVLLLAITIVLIGLFSYSALPKRLNPEVKIPIVIVSTMMPGAAPQDVESLLTVPIEKQMRGLKGVDTVSSISRDNVSIITAQFFSSVSPEKAKDDVQSAVDSVGNLPSQALRSSVKALDFEDQPIWTFTVTTKHDLPSLLSFSKEMKERIKNIPIIDRVITSGYEDHEVVVLMDPEKVRNLGVNPLAIAQAISKGNASFPSGTVQSSGYTFSLTIDPQVESIESIRSLPILVQGKPLTLGSIASVYERSKLNQSLTYVADPTVSKERGVTFYVYKTSNTNIDVAGEKVKTVVDEMTKEYNNQYTVTTIVNTSEEITKQFTDLLKEFRSTIILVFLCLLLFLGLRQAVISSFTVPLTFLSAFFFMRLSGMSINFLSLFAFLLALGLLVDDTIVTVSAMTTYFNTKKFTPLETGLLVWRDTIVPIWSTTITTIWSFVPLLITSGIIGEFIKPIPIVVTVTMLSSTAIAVLVTLPLMIVLLKPEIPQRVKNLGILIGLLALVIFVIAISGPSITTIPSILVLIALLVVGTQTQKHWQAKVIAIRKNSPLLQKGSAILTRIMSHGVINTEGFSHWYHNTILKILKSRAARRKVLIAIGAYAIFSFALLPLGFVHNEFFPKSDQNEIGVTLELPPGTPIDKTAIVGSKVLETLRHTTQVDFVTAEVGKGNSSNAAGSDSQNAVSYTLHLVPKEHRKISSITIAESLRTQFKTFNEGELSITEASGGPPAGSDLQIKLLGSDLAMLDQYAQKVVEYLKSQPGVINVTSSMKSGTSKIVFVPDQTKLAQAGLSTDAVALWMRTFASGLPLHSMTLETDSSDDKTDIVFYIGDDSLKPESIGRIAIINNQGVSYPLLSLGGLELKASPTNITREDGKRMVTISAGVSNAGTITSTNKKLEKFATDLHLPTGYSWKTGGVNDENKKSVQSILQAMVVSAILILVTMVIQFKSFRQAVIVLIVIPLAVSSVFLAFALTGTALSFPALIGVLSLFGIVVTNSMFIVDKININRREGMSFEESIADAGASRMEPIILTKLCTVFGLLPITISDPLWRGLGGAIISGLLVASTIMLLFIPVLYYSWFYHESAEYKAKIASKSKQK